MSRSIIDDTNLTKVANAIREKGKLPNTSLMFPDEFISSINNMKLSSIRRSVIVTASEEEQDYISIPITDLSTLQFIHISLVDTDTYDVFRVFTLNISMSSANRLDRYSIVSDNDYDAGMRQYLEDNSSGYVNVTKYANSIGVTVDSGSFGYFHGRYACEILGI